ncbi:DUF2975 domain-containing protein [Vibrio caribbeanicus]|uniref:DUF2975 domain-containing protein n=1 Tax=Vibrio caribbeanicus TaxID=701175 RepID=UPI0030D799BD
MKQQSISHFSRNLVGLFWFSMVLIISLDTVFWFSTTMYNFNPPWFSASFPIEVTLPLSTARSVIGYFPSIISTLVTVAILWQLIVLFRLYKEGIIFEFQNALCFKKISYLLIATPFIEIMSDILLSLALSFNGENWNMSFTIDDSAITAMIIGFIVQVIAVVMEKAVHLQEESKLTI